MHFLTSCQMYALLNDTYFPKITQTHKEFQNKSNIDKLPYLYGEILQCASQQQDLWPIAMRKGQPVEHKQHCKYHKYLCLFVFLTIHTTTIFT